MIATIKLFLSKVTFQVDTSLYVAIAVLGYMSAGTHFAANTRFWLGTTLVALTAWKAKRSPGKTTDGTH